MNRVAPDEHAMVGCGAAMQALRRRIWRLADAPGAVLIQGETGAGKELVARALHRASGRRRRPFVALNCAAVPPQLLEAELFGCLEGAFTGARQRPGLFRQAHGGTLFLDEIGDLAAPAQAAILRALETGEVRPVGGELAQRVDLRLVCATHRVLTEAVRSGAFRGDLYHRISTFVVFVPPLRDRLEDLPALGRALVGPEAERLSSAAWARLRLHPWPGNVRELRNVLLRAITEHDGPLGPEAIDFPGDATPPAPSGSSLRARIAALVLAEVVAHGGNVRAAARALEVSPGTVYRHLRDATAAVASRPATLHPPDVGDR